MRNKTEALQSTYDLFHKDVFYWLRYNAQDKGLGENDWDKSLKKSGASWFYSTG